MMDELFEILLSEISNICKSNTEKKLELICVILRNNVRHYDWVGFYFAKPDENMLILGPFAGEPTEHIEIPYGRGICGQSAETGKIFIVDDVRKENNYLACNVNVKSEMVVPIFKHGKFIGELDIDSHSVAPFTREDKLFLKRVCEYVAEIF